jgi:glycosyltransferase involved in cell wall biosynthesis
MKLLFVIPTLAIGGAEVFTKNLTNYLSNEIPYCKNIEVNLLNLDYYFGNNELEEQLNSNINYLKIKKLTFFKMLQSDVFFIKFFHYFFYYYYQNHIITEIKSIIKKIGPDIIISNLLVSDMIISKCTFKGKKVLIDHGDYKCALKNKTKILDKFDKIVCVSDSNKVAMTNYYNSERIVRIYNGGTFKNISYKRSDFAIPEEAFVFSMIARGILEKGWLEAIKAFEIINKESKKYLFLVGAGVGIDNAKLYAQEKNLQNVIFTGFENEPYNIINISDAIILPSYFISESFPISLVDSILAGKPVIATNVGGISEIVKNTLGDAGILVNLIDGKPQIEDSAQAMNELINNYSIYTKNICKERFTMERCAYNYFNLFLDLIQNNSMFS